MARFLLIPLLLLSLTAASRSQESALALYRPYLEARQHLGEFTNDYGQLLLRLAPEQLDHHFARGTDGVFPISPQGSNLFSEQFDEAYQAAREAQRRGNEAIRRAPHLDADSRSLLYALLPIWGLRRPRLTGDGDAVIFEQRMHDGAAPVFELPLELGGPRDGLYSWDLRSGRVDCAEPGGPCWSQPGPLVLENAPPIPEANRVVGPASVSADGSKVVFVCGTRIAYDRDWIEESYHLVLWVPATGRLRSLLGPCERLYEPVLARDGGYALILAARSGQPPQLWRVPSDGRTPQVLPAPPGGAWDHDWNGVTMALSDDGQVWLAQSTSQGLTRVYQGRGDGEPRPLSEENSSWPTLSGDGRWAAFSSQGVYLMELATGAKQLVSRGADGQPWSGAPRFPHLSRDGQRLVFCCDLTVVEGTVPPDIQRTVATYRARRLVLYDRGARRFLTLGGRL